MAPRGLNPHLLTAQKSWFTLMQEYQTARLSITHWKPLARMRATETICAYLLGEPGRMIYGELTWKLSGIAGLVVSNWGIKPLFSVRVPGNFRPRSQRVLPRPSVVIGGFCGVVWSESTLRYPRSSPLTTNLILLQKKRQSRGTAFAFGLKKGITRCFSFPELRDGGSGNGP